MYLSKLLKGFCLSIKANYSFFCQCLVHNSIKRSIIFENYALAKTFRGQASKSEEFQQDINFGDFSDIDEKMQIYLL